MGQIRWIGFEFDTKIEEKKSFLLMLLSIVFFFHKFIQFFGIFFKLPISKA